jgi:predicted alpha/beta superfamily hydrolase
MCRPVALRHYSVAARVPGALRPHARSRARPSHCPAASCPAPPSLPPSSSSRGASAARAQGAASPIAPSSVAPAPAAPLVVGETFTIRSAVLGEVRRINVYAPPAYAGPPAARLPVLYMPDGGLGEDFLHVAGLVQVLTGNGTMRPFLLVGIENTERRRDMTGPTDTPRDRRIAPRVGGSAAFRRFLRAELMPEVRARYRTTAETAVVGESLAGLFVVETFLREPDLFDTYLAFDPSLWWDGGRLVEGADAVLRARPAARKALFLANSDEPELAQLTTRLAGVLAAGAFPGLTWQHVPLAGETHATIYHPAALRAFRTVFRPPPR